MDQRSPDSESVQRLLRERMRRYVCWRASMRERGSRVAVVIVLAATFLARALRPRFRSGFAWQYPEHHGLGPPEPRRAMRTG